MHLPQRTFRWVSMLAILIAISLGLRLCNPDIEQDQQKLAERFGVRINDYFAPRVFPLGYFASQLRVGHSTISDVHSVIREYTKVLKCDEFVAKREIYYFFSAYDRVAVRLEVWYDESGKLEGLNSEDQNSRDINSDGCSPGLLEETIQSR